MISLLIFVISVFGVVAFYTNVFPVLLIATIVIIADSIYNVFYTKEQNTFLTEVIAVIVGFCISIYSSSNMLDTILVSLCYESALMSLIGFISFIVTLSYTKNTHTNKENIVNEIVKSSGLPYEICSDCYDIIMTAKTENKESAMQMIHEILIPHLKQQQIYTNVGIAIGMLISEELLSKEEAQSLSKEVITEMVNEQQKKRTTK